MKQYIILVKAIHLSGKTLIMIYFLTATTFQIIMSLTNILKDLDIFLKMRIKNLQAMSFLKIKKLF
tara:strand:- start:323 stop:520 length:198 start_codon:yes stop_codon:yes gene_type:complete